MFEKIVIITRKTRLEKLIERFNSRDQARFYIEHMGGDFSDYEREHAAYRQALTELRRSLAALEGLKSQIIDRNFLPNFLFTEKDIVIPIGQDGLVVNTAKYLDGQPVIGVNPDPARFDGILLPFQVPQVKGAILNLMEGRHRTRAITMAEAVLNDGQRLLAFNDLFIGAKSHISARYRLTFAGETEQHSSSGIIVSTGAGSTGWLSSIFHMAAGVAEFATGSAQGLEPARWRFDWEAAQLIFVVREPFVSQTSQAGLVAGIIRPDTALVLESLLPDQGLIFSDGIEADYLPFNAGAIAHIRLAEKKTHLVLG